MMLEQLGETVASAAMRSEAEVRKRTRKAIGKQTVKPSSRPATSFSGGSLERPRIEHGTFKARGQGCG